MESVPRNHLVIFSFSQDNYYLQVFFLINKREIESCSFMSICSILTQGCKILEAIACVGIR